MRFRLILALVTAAACGGGGSGDTGGTPNIPTIPSTPEAPVATTSVALQNSLFNPTNIVVAPSATITFNNADGILHNVNFANTSITSIGEWSSGTRTAAMPAAVGTYGYTCTLHPGMSGSVKVQ